jgi:lariat debranching enzyme
MSNKAKEIYFGVVGDVHGHMNSMVHMLTNWQSATNQKLEFVLQVGDFEPHRNETDLATMAAPSKYRKVGDFPDYFAGKARFPFPLYFIGGNHEPYGFLDQLPANSEIAENCYYIGRAGKIEISGLTIVGLSGIYREDRFTIPRPHITEIDRRSNKDYIYFTKDDVDKASDYPSPHILLLHEWPANIISEDNRQELERLRHALGYDDVGNEYSRLLMEILEPGLVVCGHMHKRYRKQITLESGKIADVCCLANVEQGTKSIAIYKVLNTGNMVEIPI